MRFFFCATTRSRTMSRDCNWSREGPVPFTERFSIRRTTRGPRVPYPW